ncbi:DNA repair protein [Chitinophagaceae bacterium IBVUCB1]|nr:DNA repair protein [Chitinophagaceae bacterium IBVUCB1]
MAVDTLYKISEVELVYRTKVKASERPSVNTSGDAYNILMQYWDENKIELLEQFKILLLNRASHVIGISDISTGGVAGTVVDPKIVFSTALKANASSIILAHNHPSGNLQPSKEDNAVTSKMREAGSFLDLRVLDHLIVTKDGYYSYADEGTLCLP